MGYEIQKKSISVPNVWYMIALADTREWAKEITNALNMCRNGEFRFVKK